MLREEEGVTGLTEKIMLMTVTMIPLMMILAMMMMKTPEVEYVQAAYQEHLRGVGVTGFKV